MKKQIIVIAAVSRNGVYGEDRKIPWNLPVDMKHFKELTTEHTVIMGRKTWESLSEKFRPLPNRDNFVVSTNEKYQAKGATVAISLERAVVDAQTEKVFCIGGSRIWYEAMNIASEAWITVIEKDFPITEGVTQIAKYLLTPQHIWGINLKEIKRPIEKEGSDPYFEIYHWVR